MKENSFYEQDLAYIHHVGYGRFAEGAGRELLRLFRDNGLESGRIIDLGCGSGLWARILTEEGYEAFGIDLSEEMIAIARETAPGARFQVASLHDAELEPCVSVTALGEVINYCAGGSPTAGALERLFGKVASALENGGIFAFDIIVQSGDGEMNYRSWKKGEEWAVLVEVSERPSTNELTREITAFRKAGEGYRKSVERHRVRKLDAGEIIGLLEAYGFAVSVSQGYGAFVLGPGRRAFVARKIKP